MRLKNGEQWWNDLSQTTKSLTDILIIESLSRCSNLTPNSRHHQTWCGDKHVRESLQGAGTNHRLNGVVMQSALRSKRVKTMNVVVDIVARLQPPKPSANYTAVVLRVLILQCFHLLHYRWNLYALVAFWCRFAILKQTIKGDRWQYLCLSSLFWNISIPRYPKISQVFLGFQFSPGWHHMYIPSWISEAVCCSRSVLRRSPRNRFAKQLILIEEEIESDEEFGCLIAWIFNVCATEPLQISVFFSVKDAEQERKERRIEKRRREENMYREI